MNKSSNECVGKILWYSKFFELNGYLDRKSWIFKINSSSDVTIINCRFIDSDHRKIFLIDKFLKYPTGENDPVLFKKIVLIDLGQYSGK